MTDDKCLDGLLEPPARSVEEVSAAFDLIIDEIGVVDRAAHGGREGPFTKNAIKLLRFLETSLINLKKEKGV